MKRPITIAVLLLLLLAACGRARDSRGEEPSTTVATSVEPASGTRDPAAQIDSTAFDGCIQTGVSTCTLNGYAERPYEIHVPTNYDGSPIPIVVNFHGGGGSIESALETSCPGGDITSERCLQAIGMSAGFVVVFPSGTGGPILKEIRTWNAGGDGIEWNCASGRACKQDVDDTAYVTALLDDIEAQLNITNVYATGLSNGAAMSHRVACEMSDRVHRRRTHRRVEPVFHERVLRALNPNLGPPNPRNGRYVLELRNIYRGLC